MKLENNCQVTGRRVELVRAFTFLPAAALGLLTLSAQVHAHNVVAGQSSNGNVVVNSSNNWTIIRSVTVTIPATDFASHSCVAVASADVDSPGPAGVENQYRFALSRNDANPVTDTGSERRLELVDNNGVDDPDSKPVATNQHYTGLTRTNGTNGTGNHTFYFLGRKYEAADTNVTVTDAGISVICTS